MILVGTQASTYNTHTKYICICMCIYMYIFTCIYLFTHWFRPPSGKIDGWPPAQARSVGPRLGEGQKPNFKAGYNPRTPPGPQVAVKELKLSHQNSDTIVLTVNPYRGNLIHFLNSNPAFPHKEGEREREREPERPCKLNWPLVQNPLPGAASQKA